MTAEKLTVTVTNSEELKKLCDTAESLMKELRETVKQIEDFELDIEVK